MDSPSLIRDPQCTRCSLNETAQYVCLLGSGAIRSDVMIVGEAPGHREDDSGIPFVGRSGKLLRSILNDNGFTDDKVFITNAVSCRPPENRTPSAKEVKACRHWLQYQIGIVKPKYILLLGNVPLLSLLDMKGITKHRGKPVEVDGIVYLPTFHPASTFHDPSKQKYLEADIQAFRRIVDGGGVPEEQGLDYTIVTDEAGLSDMLNDLHGSVSFDIETNMTLYPWGKDAKIRAIGFGTKKHQWIVYFDDWESGRLRRIFRKIDDKLKDCLIIAHNGKFDSLWVRVHLKLKWDIDFDTMLAHYILDENSRHGLKFLSTAFLGAPDYAVNPLTAERDKLCKYLALDLFYTRKLKLIFSRMMKKDSAIKEVFDRILMPCSLMFTEAQENGIFIDTPKMDEAESYLRNEVAEAKKILDGYCSRNPVPGKHEEMNWGSTQQVAHLLFVDLGLDIVEKTEKGNASTNESVLKRIDHPLVESLLRYRGAKQQLSFFIDGWKPYLVDNMLHPDFKIHGTVTGRLSCQNPNLQQVPRDTRIRSLVTAPPGWVLVEADLSQIEMRIAAELSGEPNLLDSFYQGIDVHWKTAIREIARGAGLQERVLDTALQACERGYSFEGKLTYSAAIDILIDIGHEEAIVIDPRWKETRKKAKAINFGYLYGMWWKKFIIYARDNYGIKVSEFEAQESRKAFFELYPKLKEWHDKQQNYARRNGYVSSLSGRKRRLPDAQSEIEKIRKVAQRQAINSPVQSFANDLNLMAAIQLHREFDSSVLRIVATIHDAILFWVRQNKVRQVVPQILKVMSHPKMMDDMGIKLRVPIEAEATIGPWGKGVSLKTWLSEYRKVA